MEDKIINMESVQDYNEILGVETLHPLVSVVDLAEVQQIKHCIRFYDRQFLTREIVNHELMESFQTLLEGYYESSETDGIPTVGWFADRLHLSPNYFGDLVKRETGISAQEYIQNHIIEKAKSREKTQISREKIICSTKKVGRKHGNNYIIRIFRTVPT